MPQMLDLSRSVWRKSSYSASAQGNCVEVAEAAWRTSSYSASSGGNCVEVAAPGPVAIRDSKNPDGGILAVSRRSWSTFLTTIRTH